MSLRRITEDQSLGPPELLAGSLDDALVQFHGVIEVGVRRYAAGMHDAGREPLHASLQRICSLAHAERVPPETLLVRLKNALDESPAFQDLSPDGRDEFRASAVTFAIAAYYADEPHVKDNVTPTQAVSSAPVALASDRIDEPGHHRV